MGVRFTSRREGARCSESQSLYRDRICYAARRARRACPPQHHHYTTSGGGGAGPPPSSYLTGLFSERSPGQEGRPCGGRHKAFPYAGCMQVVHLSLTIPGRERERHRIADAGTRDGCDILHTHTHTPSSSSEIITAVSCIGCQSRRLKMVVVWW